MYAVSDGCSAIKPRAFHFKTHQVLQCGAAWRRLEAAKSIPSVHDPSLTTSGPTGTSVLEPCTPYGYETSIR